MARSAMREELEPVLRDMLTPGALTLLEAAPGAPLQMLRRLMAARPQIVIAEAAAPHALEATIYRTMRPHSRLLLYTLRAKPLQLRRADGIVGDASEVRRAVERLRARPAPVPALHDIDLFRSAPPERAREAAHRLLYVGDLAPTSYAPDVLIALANWAERHPQRRGEIWWAGDGDLSGVLAAQPLPPNVTQQFHGAVARPELADLMARCGVLVAAADASAGTAPIVEALTSGLVVLASRRMTAARPLLAAGPGWLFDPAQPDGLAAALEQVLACDPASLDVHREQGMRLAASLETAAPDITRPALPESLARSPFVSSGALT